MLQTHVPMLDPRPEVERLMPEFLAVFQAVLRSGEYIMGSQVRAFEQEVAAYAGCAHAIAVNSGTDALAIALRALGVGAGDEVITTPFTFFATAEAVSALGAIPIFCEVDPDTGNLDPLTIEALVTRRTRAIIPVHLYGQSADLEGVMALAAAYDLKVLEDVAQAFGGRAGERRLGTIGDAGALSFFPSKNLGGYGDGGMVLTDDPACAEACRMLRVHGAKKKYHNEVVGYNSRLDELQAAMLRVKLPALDTQNALRRQAAERYNALLNGLEAVTLPLDRTHGAHVYHQYTLKVPPSRRDRIQAALTDAGVQTMIYYPIPVHRLPVYAGRYPDRPVAEHWAASALSLPIWPGISEEAQHHVARALMRAMA